MPTPQQLRSRLLKTLKELFQLDQPDLDFGFYRIMHAKSVQVQEFIEKDLLKIVADAFGEVDEARSASLKAEYEKAIETAREFGAPAPEKAPKVQEAKARWDSTRGTAASESDIYDHLYRFFERYYDGGDFMSRRYYARETPGKAAPYAIPYNGEEVKLHWANADQYYIKTAEYFSNFTFDLTQAAEIRALSHEERVLYQVPENQKTKLSIDGKLQKTMNEPSTADHPVWWFQKVEGWVPGDPSNPDNGKRENVLIVWRKLTGNPEEDNAVLDEWFRKNRISPRGFKFDIIYVNGSSNLPNLRQDSESWKVRLMEEEFMKRMWDVEGV